MSHNVSLENFSQAKTYTCCIKIDPESITMFKWIHAVFYNLFQFASLFHATNTIPNYFQHVFIRRSYFRLCDSDQIFPLKVCVFANVKFSFTLLSKISYIRTVMFVFTNWGLKSAARWFYWGTQGAVTADQFQYVAT